MLWVFTPCYLDLRSFLQVREHLLANIAKDLPQTFAGIQFVLIDDTGDQDPELRAGGIPEDVCIVSPPFNLGHQRAIVYGLRKKKAEIADEDFVLTLDSDGEDQPGDAARLLQPLLDSASDLRGISIAWRTRRRESLLFKVMYFFYKILFIFLTGQIIRSGNFVAYRGWTVKHVITHPHFDLCYSSSLLSLNIKNNPVPCERGSRYFGQSRMNFQKLVLHGIRMLMPFLDRIATRALVCFSAVSALGLAASAAIVGIRAFTNYGIPGWASYMLLLTLLISITSLGQFIILITIVSQSQGLALSGIDKEL